LAESFSNPESHQGTLCKITNWLPMGQTAVCSRSRADFDTDAQKPKLLWLYPLRSDARELSGRLFLLCCATFNDLLVTIDGKAIGVLKGGIITRCRL
jgi:hypothetical protein